MKQEYGEVMQFLLHFREQYHTEEAYRQFLLRAMRELVGDLREFGVFISLQPEFLGRPRAAARAAGSTTD
ncbi:MAG: hypothetical protein HY314_12180 [Acidobacteria bacterium]|nr:hypothetical protein [Acidobacteriota bacterium]